MKKNQYNIKIDTKLISVKLSWLPLSNFFIFLIFNFLDFIIIKIKQNEAKNETFLLKTYLASLRKTNNFQIFEL